MSSDVLERLLANRAAFLDFVASRVESRAVAEDLLQDALSRALDRAGELRSSDAAVGWFYQVLRNAVIDHHRRRQAAQRKLERLAAEVQEAPGEPEPPRRVCPCVARLAKTLKPEYAEALQKVEVEGVAVKAFGDEVGITAGNAAVRVFRARDSLKKKVAHTCGACAAAGCTDCDCVAPAE